jgi:hypothetical protein
VRTPIGYHAVRTVRRIALATVANDGVVRRIDRQLVEPEKHRGSWGKAVDAGRHMFKANVLLKRSGDHVHGSA